MGYNKLAAVKAFGGYGEVKKDGEVVAVLAGAVGPTGAAGATADEMLKTAAVLSATLQQVQSNSGELGALWLSTKAASIVGIDPAVVPLTVDSPLGQAENLFELKVDDVSKAYITNLGQIYGGSGFVTPGLINCGGIFNSLDWYIADSEMQLANDFEFEWSGTSIYGGAKVQGLALYDDGAKYWLKATDGSTGDGSLVADQFMVGGTGGLRLTQSPGFVNVRDNADSGYGSLRAAGVYTDSLLAATGNVTMFLQGRTFVSADNAVEVVPTFTNSTGLGVAVATLPTINQSGDASWCASLVNATVTAEGSGTKRLADWQVNDVSKTWMDNGGGIFLPYFKSSVFDWEFSTNGLTFANNNSVFWSGDATYYGTKVADLSLADSGTAYYVAVGDGVGGLGRLQVGAGDATDLGLQIGASGYGFTSATNTMSMYMNGNWTWHFTTGQIYGGTTRSGAILNETSTNVNPTLCPDRSNFLTGVGGESGYVSLIANSTEIMRLETSGITANAEVALGAVPIANIPIVVRAAAAGANAIRIETSAGSANYWDMRSTYGFSNPDLSFVPNGGSEVLTLNANGYVGIANNNPLYALHVTGDIAIDTGLVLSNWDSGTAYYFRVESGGGIRVPAGTATDPSLLIGTDGSGVFEQSSNYLGVSIAGIQYWSIGASYLRGLTTGGPSLVGGGSSSTVPAYGFKGDEDLGMGRAGANQLSLIANSTEIMRVEETKATCYKPFWASNNLYAYAVISVNNDYKLANGIGLQLAKESSVYFSSTSIHSGAAALIADLFDSSTAYYLDISTGGGIRVPAGSATDPSLLIGASGFYEGTATIVARAGGSNVGAFLATGALWGVFAGGPGNFKSGLLFETALATNPNIIPSYGSPGTGIGSAGANQLSLIANSTEIMRLETTGVTANAATLIQGDGNNAEFIALNLSNFNEPTTGQTGDITSLQLSLSGSSDSGSSYASEMAAKILAYKVGDWWGSNRADFDSGLKFYVKNNGSELLGMTINSSGKVTIPDNLVFSAASGSVLFNNVTIDEHDAGTAYYADYTGGGIRVPAGTATDPSLLIGVHGIYDQSSTNLVITIAGSSAWQAATGYFGGTSGGGMLRSQVGYTSPSLSYYGDSDTGWGTGAANTQSGVCGGVEIMRLSSTGPVVKSGILGFDNTMTSTAKDPTTDAPDDWVEVDIGGTQYFIPAYLAVT